MLETNEVVCVQIRKQKEAGKIWSDIMFFEKYSLEIPPSSAGAPKILVPSPSSVSCRPSPKYRLAYGMAGIPRQPSLMCLSVGRPGRRGRRGFQIPSVASLVGSKPRSHHQHRSINPGLGLSDKVLLCPPMLASPPSPSGG